MGLFVYKVNRINNTDIDNIDNMLLILLISLIDEIFLVFFMANLSSQINKTLGGDTKPIRGRIHCSATQGKDFCCCPGYANKNTNVMWCTAVLLLNQVAMRRSPKEVIWMEWFVMT